jgi:hypothetical protein
MKIDNSRANKFRTCPPLYFESYVRNGGLEPKRVETEGYSPIELGARGHELLEEWYKGTSLYPPSPNDALEREAQWIVQLYKVKYPKEEFQIMDIERVFEIPLPNSTHIYTGKIDLVGFNAKEDFTNFIIDHKFQSRAAKTNHPMKWAARDQASLYLWAAEQIYGVKPSNFFVNILVRPSEKGLVPPTFPERQKLERTQEQIDTAVRDITFIADQIEAMEDRWPKGDWPSNREECYTWGPCDFYQPHTYGWSNEILENKFQKRKEYLKAL